MGSIAFIYLLHIKYQLCYFDSFSFVCSHSWAQFLLRYVSILNLIIYSASIVIFTYSAGVATNHFSHAYSRNLSPKCQRKLLLIDFVNFSVAAIELYRQSCIRQYLLSILRHSMYFRFHTVFGSVWTHKAMFASV